MRIALLALCVAAGALFVMGCSHRSGHKVYPTPTAVPYNLHVDNTDWDHIHVIVDGGDMGTVDGDDDAYFWLTPGFHDIAIRESGLLFDYDAGTYWFSSSDVVHVTY